MSKPNRRLASLLKLNSWDSHIQQRSQGKQRTGAQAAPQPAQRLQTRPQVRPWQCPHPAEAVSCAAVAEAGQAGRAEQGRPAGVPHHGQSPGQRRGQGGAGRRGPAEQPLGAPANYKPQNAPEVLVYPSNLPMRARGARHVSGARFPSLGGSAARARCR